MMKKIVSRILLTLLSMGMLTLAFSSQATSLLTHVKIFQYEPEIVTEVIFPSDDSFVGKEAIINYSWVDTTDWNYGNSSRLIVSTTTVDGRDRRAFLKFSLSSLSSPEDIASVKLGLFKSDYYPPGWGGVENVEAREVADDSWTEENITWNNQVGYGSLLDTVYIVFGSSLWYFWNVTPFISDELAGDKVASLCLKAENEDGGYAHRWSSFWSKEYDDFDPHLLVTYKPKPLRMLTVKLSGGHDYLYMERVKIRVTALVTDSESMEPVSDADITIDIYDPDGNLWSSDNMTEKLAGTGIYEWQSDETIRQLMGNRQLRKGVYLVHVQAAYQRGPTATDILEFHIDPLPENPTQLHTILMFVLAGALVTTIIVWYIDHGRLTRNLQLGRTTS